MSTAAELQILVNGEWVRNKLLGIPTTRLKIGLSTMVGTEFGDFVNSFYHDNRLKYQTRALDLQVQNTDFSEFKRVDDRSNAKKAFRKSTASVFGLAITLIHLHKDEFEDDERRDESDWWSQFGTPEDDALMADCTISALFYDVEKQQVLDPLEQGLADLDAGVLRTPMEEWDSFWDEPVRVLRLIRFAAELGFSIDQDTKDGMMHPKTMGRVSSRVERASIANELSLMMKSSNPEQAFDLIYELGFYDLIFLNPESTLQRDVYAQYRPSGEGTPSFLKSWPQVYQSILALKDDAGSNIGQIIREQTNFTLPWLLASYAPVADLRHNKLGTVVKGITNALNMSREVTKLFDSALTNLDSIREMVDLINKVTDGDLPRSILGMQIRNWGADWQLQVLYALLAELSAQSPANSPQLPSKYDDNAMDKASVAKYDKFLAFVEEQNLQRAYAMRPLLNGLEIKETLGDWVDGKAITAVGSRLAAWQFDNPRSDEDDAKAWLRQQRGTLQIRTQQ